MPDTCQLCEKRRVKRSCPGVHGGICAQCCGEQREVTIDCPLDCEFLTEARKHERMRQFTEADYIHPDVRVTEQFMRDRVEVIMFAGFTLWQATLATQGAVDSDVREALDAAIKTQRTLDSGLIYETRPANPFAAAIQARLMQGFTELGSLMTPENGSKPLRDVEILGVLVFLARISRQHDNERRRGRAFVSFLQEQFSAPPDFGPGDGALVTG